MSVTKKHTLEPVTDNLLKADKSPEDYWNYSEQCNAAYKGSSSLTDSGRGSRETTTPRRTLRDRAQQLAKERAPCGGR